ncbi:MAG: hypothetical protein L6N95_04440 [Candidatus Methylarchaceae archaeon HK01B]|nr:hypothetical protein [Candidatus Methylarchaceae archaeon HK01B]
MFTTTGKTRYRRFEDDLNVLVDKLSKDMDNDVKKKLEILKKRLIKLYHDNLVKINHSVMELICGKSLLTRGYDIDLERGLDMDFVCDIFAEKGEGILIIEVETGYTPPDHALDPSRYNEARISSKIARYSSYSNKFALATPIYNILQIPEIFSKPPRYRNNRDVMKVKTLCDIYYTRPPITVQQIKEAQLQSIYIIDVDRTSTREIDPETYQDLVSSIRSTLA